MQTISSCAWKLLRRHRPLRLPTCLPPAVVPLVTSRRTARRGRRWQDVRRSSLQLDAAMGARLAGVQGSTLNATSDSPRTGSPKQTQKRPSYQNQKRRACMVSDGATSRSPMASCQTALSRASAKTTARSHSGLQHKTRSRLAGEDASVACSNTAIGSPSPVCTPTAMCTFPFLRPGRRSTNGQEGSREFLQQCTLLVRWSAAQQEIPLLCIALNHSSNRLRLPRRHLC